MSVPFSAIDVATRLEVQDLLSRFCHAIDHNRLADWKSLFQKDGVVEAPRLGSFTGLEQIETIPGMVHAQGKGAWRHHFNNVYIQPADGNLRVEAYSLVSDWRKAGHVIRCWDFSAEITKKRGLKFVHIVMRAVGDYDSSSLTVSDMEIIPAV